MDIFNKLRNLYLENKKGNLVIFVGAGVSQYYSKVEDNTKFPSWDGLTKEFIIDKSSENGCIDYLKVPQIYEDTYSRKDLIDKVIDSFPKNYKCGELHKLIFDIQPAHIITTNYDDLLEKAMLEKNLTSYYHTVFEDKSIPFSDSKYRFLLKAHGDLKKGNIVLTEQDYNDYEKNFPLMLSFIRYMFSKYKVLFIGFSLNDPNFNKILYWVKNILEHNSIEHTLISHSNITQSIKKYFKKKSVDVITSEEIINEITSNKDGYLIPVLEFIKYGFSDENFSKKQRLEILLKNIANLKSFNYLLPEIVKKSVSIDNITFNYESLPQILNKNTKKEERTFPYTGNIYQKDLYIGTKDALNIYFSIIEAEDIDKISINEIYTIFLMSNIIHIGDTKSFDTYISIKSDNILNELATYTFDENGLFIENDLSFEKGYSNYTFLTFSKKDFYIDYLLGDKNSAYNKCKRNAFDENNYIKKYLYYFRLHYLFNGRKIQDYVDLDMDSFEVYKNEFEIFNKREKKVIENIHNLDFINDFETIIEKTEIEYEKYLKKMSNILFHGSSNPNENTHFKDSFYINYSRFLKFILLNRLPIIQEFSVQKAIHKANKFYLNSFMEENIKISNWNLIGILLDSNEAILEDIIIKKHNKNFKKNILIDFDHSFIKEIFLNNINEDFNNLLLRYKNIFNLISLSAKKEKNFILILDLFYKLIKTDVKNLEYFSLAFRISYINYKKNNNFCRSVKLKIKKILNLYIEYKLTALSKTNKDINDDVFSNFILRDFNMKYQKKDSNILELLKSDELEISCQNLTSLIYLLKSMGYQTKDIEKNIITPIKDKFQDENFYIRFNYPGNKCPNQIENSVIKIYQNYFLDLGIEKIEEYYTNNLLTKTGSEKDNAIAWVIYLIDNKLISKKFYSSIEKEDVIKKFSNDITHMLKKDSITPFDKWLNKTRNVFVEFLIKTKNTNLIVESLKELNQELNSDNFRKLFNYLIRQQEIINKYKKDLVQILNFFDKSKLNHITLPAKYLLINNKGIENIELQNLLKQIFENYEDSI